MILYVNFQKLYYQTHLLKKYFRIFHLSCSGLDLGLKLRQKYVDYALMNGLELKIRRTVQTQIKFLETLHEKVNHILVTYQNADRKLGKLISLSLALIN